jgi:nucleolar protein 56
MTDGWFAGLNPDDVSAAADRITNGQCEQPASWPEQAIESGFVDDTDAYYERLRAAAIEATETTVRERERADDQQLVHTVRAMDDCERTANELAERVTAWAGSRYGESGGGIEYAQTVAQRAEDDDPALASLAKTVTDLADEADKLRATVEQTAPAVAPNLSMLAGPILAARLISITGGLESLAKKPSGTLQVLGAEDALFAHLRGNAPSPKHGIIFTHEYVSGTRSEERGSAARALAGKLSIAARIDHYSGDRRPELQAELDERIERIQSRGEGE